MLSYGAYILDKPQSRAVMRGLYNSCKFRHPEISDFGSNASDQQDIVSSYVSVDETIGV